jgi:alpha-aminoadipic semialdehyde synthase
VLVQSSKSRCYTDEEFLQAGATISEDFSDASIIFGVKEVPTTDLMPDKTYFFFSHTLKAQQSNMQLLDTLLEKRIRLVDFECIRNEAGRLVAFGRFAGIAGTFDFLRGCGEYFL